MQIWHFFVWIGSFVCFLERFFVLQSKGDIYLVAWFDKFLLAINTASKKFENKNFIDVIS